VPNPRVFVLCDEWAFARHIARAIRKLTTLSSPYACQVNPQLPQTVGFRPANKANSPTGKKQMETMISHTGKPPREVIVLHLGQETTAMKSPYERISFAIHTRHKLTDAQRLKKREHRSIKASVRSDEEQSANGRARI
jgi:hypothetical protein